MPAAEEEKLLRRLQALVEDGQSVSGRDASVISSEAQDIEKEMKEAPTQLSAKGHEKAKEALEEIKASDAFEKGASKICQMGILICTFLPMVLTALGSVQEWALRPSMVVAPADLSGKLSVVTGGCGSLGLELGVMLAKSGAGVILGCHADEGLGALASETATDRAWARIDQLGLRRTKDDQETTSFGEEETSSGGWMDIWPLQLESFAGVRQFASRVAAEGDLDLLVHNAATKKGCTLRCVACRPRCLHTSHAPTRCLHTLSVMLGTSSPPHYTPSRPTDPPHVAARTDTSTLPRSTTSRPSS
jgi:hypothetical protein